MNKYIDALMEKHSPSDPYLMSWPQAAAAIREAMAAAREDLAPYCIHESSCPMAQWSGGRPTADGGYEQSYGYAEKKKWYPAGKHPPCTCGLLDALGAMDDEEGSE